MYWLDTTILGVLGVGALLGACSGFVRQLSRLVTLGVALYATVAANELGTQFIQEVVFVGTAALLARAVAYLAVFAAVYLALHGVTLLVERGVKAWGLQWLNRLLGAGAGLTKAALCVGLLCLGLVNFSHPFTQEIKDQSTLAPLLAEGMQTLVEAVPAEYRDNLSAWLQRVEEEQVKRGQAAVVNEVLRP